MTRRDFLKRAGGAAAAMSLSPLLDLAEITPAPARACVEPLYFKDIALVFDQYCSPSVYVRGQGWRLARLDGLNP